MNRIGCLLLAALLTTATIANSAETIGTGKDVKVTVERFKPPEPTAEDFSPPKTAMTCWRLSWRGWVKHPCKCVKCNWHLPWRSRLCWRTC